MILTGPNRTISAELSENGPDEAPTLRVCHGETTLLEPSPIGIETLSESYAEGLTITEYVERTIDSAYRTPAGKRLEHRHVANETAVVLSREDGRRLELDVRIATDGVAYRYRLPGDGPVVVTGERSAFRVPSDAAAWLMPFEKKHEGIWRETTAADASGQYGFPALFEVDDGAWVSLTESGVDGRYAAARFAVEEGSSRFDLRFPDSARHRMETAEQDVSARRPLTTPWRVAIVGDLATVTESDLVADLAEEADGADPSRLEDESWIEPGRVAWSWWSDGGSPSEYDVQKRYVDYASERGWEYVLVDAGWEDEWMPDLVSYAAERDVGIFLWARWSDVDTAAKREARFSEWTSWGVAGIKVDYMNSDTQEMMRFYDDLAEATAACGLMLNVHGSITPKGLRRRWPHLLTYEGVNGAENYHPVPNTYPPSHNAILPFTRNVLGPMDYTPVTFSAETRQTTVGHELALSVVYESGLQHFADDVDEYAARPLAEAFLEAVPAAWEGTAFVGGRPASEATIARRRGSEWFLGSITAGDARTVDAPLSFLEDDSEYDLELLADDDSGEKLRRLESVVDRSETVSVAVPEHGGFAARMTPRDGSR
ncbi:glycoside hydrolase family 97 protein [Halomontanus rarus]|uniref:glycoside hydrolase family 97 protein n=1 Tax=Halomontanus rarus TaxID=3034020 RepID=UPI0023E79D3C|nr:glycoside hydrolase family 97 protein [Halovivax sp. TS33]